MVSCAMLSLPLMASLILPIDLVLFLSVRLQAAADVTLGERTLLKVMGYKITNLCEFRFTLFYLPNLVSSYG